MRAGRGLRAVLVMELGLAVLPVTVHYFFLFPVGFFWTIRVLRLALGGIVNPFTVSMALAFLLGGTGLAFLWITIVRRLLGRDVPGRIAAWGILFGTAVSLWLLFVMATIGGEFLDYYLYGAPLIAAAHQLVLGRRRRAPAVALPIVALALTLVPGPSAVAAERPRVPAEWEPALGAMVAWPAIVPESLLVEIARDDRLYLLVADSAGQADAERAMARLRIDPARVQFIVAPAGDARSWPRDWGPFPLFDEEETFRLAGHRFVDYPGGTASCDGWLYSERLLYFLDFRPDDAATALVAQALSVPMMSLPFALTGGNALVDGHGTAFSTCIMLNENRRSFGMRDDDFYRAVEARLGITRYVIVPNFEWFGIQHIDCLLKPLDEETILVKRLPEGHPDHDTIEAIARDLSTRTGPYGRPYRIRRIDTPPYLFGFFVPNYTNSLILNRKILVPLYGIPADEKALATWREIMPGYDVIGFRNDSGYDWNWLDALHCRVRAVWDPGMLYLSHRPIDERVEAAASYPVDVLIRDYSRAGLVPEALLLRWRLRGGTDWRSVPLAAGSAPHVYTGAIPSPGPGRTIEYYLSAADASGRHETLPRVAPTGFYSFSVLPSTDAKGQATVEAPSGPARRLP